MPNQSKILQADGHSFSTTDTKLRFRTQNNGSPLEHAQVDGNFEILRTATNGLVDDVLTNYEELQTTKASIAALETSLATSLDEFANIQTTNGNDIAVNKSKIDDAVTQVDALLILTAAQGVDLEANEEAIATNSAAILNLTNDTTSSIASLTDRMVEAEARLSNIGTSNQYNFTEIDTDISALKTKDTELEAQLDELSVVVAATTLWVDNFQGEEDIDLDSINNEISTLSAASTATNARIDDAVSEHNTLKESHDNLAQFVTSNELRLHTAEQSVTTLETKVDSAISPGWHFIENPQQVYMGTRYGHFDVDVHLFGIDTPAVVPENARYVMVAHEHNQGWCAVWQGGRAGNSGWLTYGAGGDNVDGGSIIVVENLQLPASHLRLQSRAGRGSPTKPSSEDTNLIPKGHVRFRFGTSDDDGSGSDHYLFLLAYSY